MINLCTLTNSLCEEWIYYAIPLLRDDCPIALVKHCTQSLTCTHPLLWKVEC